MRLMLVSYTKPLELPHDDCLVSHEQLWDFWLMATGQMSSLSKLSLVQQWAFLAKTCIDQKNTKPLLRKQSGYKLLLRLSSEVMLLATA